MSLIYKRHGNQCVNFVRFLPFSWSFHSLSTVGNCKGGKDRSMAKVTAVTLPEASGMAKAGGNKVQVLSDNIEVVERKAASGEFGKEFLQSSGVKLCCTTAVMERLGICYKRYDTLKLERLANRQEPTIKRFSSIEHAIILIIEIHFN